MARRPIAPVHRGPQAVSTSVGAPIHHAPNACLLIDFDNVTMGIRSDLQTELKNLLSSDIVKGKVAVQRAYADWRRYPQYVVPLTESSIDLIFATAYGSAKKNATDIRLAIDAMELVFVRPEIGIFILLSGDSDFSSLVIKLKEYGKYVIGVGIRESSSDLLVQNCDEYYSYNALAGLVKTGEEEMVKWDPWQLVTEAVQRMTKNGDVMRADRLKQVMQTIDSSFDEKNLGMAKFSRFVQEAAQRGLLALTRLQNGQMEVSAPNDKSGISTDAVKPLDAPASAALAAVPAPAAQDSASDDKRVRGRGRGRDRSGRPRREDRPAIAGTPESIPAAVSTAPAVSPAPATGIGSSGVRLTREEAFDLLGKAVASLVSANAASPAATVRATAREILGRDSESLSEKNFTRILQDAHDSDIVDLRKRGADYEVANSVSAAPVAQQLAATAAAAAAAAPVTPAVQQQKTMGSRVVRGRNPFGVKSTGMPANLLSVGVVGTPRVFVPAPAPMEAAPLPGIETASAQTIAAEPDSPARRAGRSSRKTGSRAARAARPALADATSEAVSELAEAKPVRTRTKRAPRSRAAAAKAPVKE